MSALSKVLITGANGFLGRIMAQKLLADGFSVVGIDITSEPFLEAPGYTYHQASFLQDPFNQKLLDDVDAVVHAANTYKPGPALTNYISDIEQNVIGTLRLYERAMTAGVRRFIFLSSGGTVYGPGHGPEPTGEDARCEPISYYGLSKLSTENYLRRAAASYPNSLAILRIANPYGIDQRANTGQGLIATVVAALKKSEPVHVWGDGTAVRDYVHVDDVAACLTPAIAYNGPQDTFNIASGQGRSVASVISSIGHVMGIEPTINYEASRFVDVPFSVLSIERAATEFGWTPVRAWDSALTELVNRLP